MENIMKLKSNALQGLCSLIVISSVTISGCSTADITNVVSNGNAMSTSSVKLRPTNPANVKLYYAGNTLPKHYKVVGRISAESYNIVGLEHTQEFIANELKKQAASVGANGVINITSNISQVTGDAVIIK
jgi:hypothetical protein